MNDELAIRPHTSRQPVHPSITEEKISALVETFYDSVWADEQLGPIFSKAVNDRSKHLEKMKDFWSSVLLKTGRYKGKPIPAHVKLTDVVDDDFQHWLSLFKTACHKVFDAAAAEKIIEYSVRIARSLWIAMNHYPVKAAPF